jgi:Holin of 3TMs, for gene-transfer release
MALLDFLNIGSKIIDKIIPDPAQKADANLKLQQLAMSGDMAELTRSFDAIVAEAQSTDKWTSRARPSFMYVIYLMILFALPYGVWYAIHPASAMNMATGLKAWLDAIPDSLWGLFGVGYTGYSVSRSYDKGMTLKHGKK